MNTHVTLATAPESVTEALRAFLTAMHNLANQQGRHGWELHVFAAEGGPESLHVPSIEGHLLRIEDYEETGEGDTASCSYHVNEVKQLWFNADGSVLVGG